ncbi:unnamed protein product, partial [marine sediment metagenome]
YMGRRVWRTLYPDDRQSGVLPYTNYCAHVPIHEYVGAPVGDEPEKTAPFDKG